MKCEQLHSCDKCVSILQVEKCGGDIYEIHIQVSRPLSIHAQTIHIKETRFFKKMFRYLLKLNYDIYSIRMTLAIDILLIYSMYMCYKLTVIFFNIKFISTNSQNFKNRRF